MVILIVAGLVFGIFLIGPLAEELLTRARKVLRTCMHARGYTVRKGCDWTKMAKKMPARFLQLFRLATLNARFLLN